MASRGASGEHAFLSAAARLAALVPLAGGAALGWLAWRPNGAVALIAALPLLWALQPTRSRAALLWLGYFLCGSRDVAPVVARFFPGEPFTIGIALWVLDAVVLTLPWLLLWPNDRDRALSVAARTAAAIVLLTVPPIGCLAWLSPLLSSGVLFPGWGWFGLAAAVVLLASLAVVGHALRMNLSAVMRQHVIALVALLIAAAGANLLYRQPAAPPDWVALDTRFGQFPEERRAGFQRQQELMRAAREAIDAGAKVVILPEEVAGTWRTAVAYWWQPLDAYAQRRGATVLVGADVPVSPGLSEEAARFADSLVLLGATQGIVSARQPIPLGSWRPWSDRSAVADLTGDGVLKLHGVRVAVSICYEDLLMWPVLVSFARPPQPQVLVSVANSWFYEGLDSLWIQRRSVELLARLFGVPLLRAVNTERVAGE